MDAGIVLIASENEINGRKTPFYALKEGFKQQKDMEFIYNNDTPLSQGSEAKTEVPNENGIYPNANDTESTSKVYNFVQEEKIEAKPSERGGTNVYTENFRKDWKDPRIDH